MVQVLQYKNESFMKNVIKKLNLFPTLVMEFDLAEYTTNDVLRALSNSGENQNSLVDGVRGTVSPMKMPACKDLFGAIQRCIDHYSDEAGIGRSKIYESWMNVIEEGGSVGVHRHYHSVVSGAYYPYVHAGSAPIVFISPLEGLRMVDLEKSTPNGTAYNPNVHNMEARTGHLILFPSWIQHYVPRNSSEFRMTVSFNTKY